MFHAFTLLVPWADASERVYRALGRFVTAKLSRADDFPPVEDDSNGRDT
jgi:hypothetical protein